MRTIRRTKYVLRFPKMRCAGYSFGEIGVGITHENSLIRLRPVHLKSQMHQAIHASHVCARGALPGPVFPDRSSSGAAASSSRNVPIDTSVWGRYGCRIEHGKITMATRRRKRPSATVSCFAHR